ncbi:MAG: hypothetical protein NWF00_01820 [Candidatus Bathyarchaeota archaeon]|nr:hypothetical protein [Candidatus Bathyarchaeota archaeon]
MKTRKNMRGIIRGWLPREANMSIHQQTVTHRFFPTRKAMVAYIALVLGAALAGALLWMLGYFLGLTSQYGFYWNLVTSMAIGIGGALIFTKIYQKEKQKEAKLREL